MYLHNREELQALRKSAEAALHAPGSVSLSVQEQDVSPVVPKISTIR